MRLFLLCLPLVLVSIICPIGGRPGQTLTEFISKKPTRCDGMECLLEKYGTKILGKNQHNGQLRNAIVGLGKKQLLFEALFGKIPENDIDSSSDEFKFYKGRLDEINCHDPALSQLLEGLICVQIHAKKALQNGNSAGAIRTTINKVKQSLAYAVFFVANRHQIQLDSARGEENDHQSLLIDSLNFYNEFEKDEQNAIKCRNSQKNDYYGKNGKEQRERFVRFVYRSLETKWDGSAFSNGQNDNDDAIGRRKRRKRRFVPPPPPSEGTDDGASFAALGLLIFLLGAIFVMACLFSICLCRRSSCCSGSRRMNSQPQQQQGALTGHSNAIRNEMDKITPAAALSIYKAITPIELQDQNRECAICLDSIQPKTMVRPLPCGHIYHHECIEHWFRGHNTCPFCRQEQEGEAHNGTENRNGTASHEVAIDMQLYANYQGSANGAN